MDATQEDAARNVLRRLIRLIDRITLVPGAKPGRLVPTLAPGDIWRIMPALILDACDLAEALGIEGEDARIRRDLATMIDQQPAPSPTNYPLTPSRN